MLDGGQLGTRAFLPRCSDEPLKNALTAWLDGFNKTEGTRERADEAIAAVARVAPGSDDEDCRYLWQNREHFVKKLREGEGVLPMFLGTHAPRLDDKGRLILPARFREELAGGVILIRGQERCLYVFTTAEFERMYAQHYEIERASCRERV